MSEFSACRFLITRFLYAGFYCIKEMILSIHDRNPLEPTVLKQAKELLLHSPISCNATFVSILMYM